MQQSRSSLLPFATATAMVLLNYPWLSMYSSSLLFVGLPPLYLYLFAAWLGFIFTVWLLIRPPVNNRA